jgi:hypothetical protein
MSKNKKVIKITDELANRILFKLNNYVEHLTYQKKDFGNDVFDVPVLILEHIVLLNDYSNLSEKIDEIPYPNMLKNKDAIIISNLLLNNLLEITTALSDFISLEEVVESSMEVTEDPIGILTSYLYLLDRIDYTTGYSTDLKKAIGSNLALILGKNPINNLDILINFYKP